MQKSPPSASKVPFPPIACFMLMLLEVLRHPVSVCSFPEESGVTEVKRELNILESNLNEVNQQHYSNFSRIIVFVRSILCIR